MELSDEEIRNKLMQSVYNQRKIDRLTKNQIIRKSGLRIKHREIDNHLHILCDRGLLKSTSKTSTKDSPFKRTGKNEKLKFTTTYFRITSNGEEFIQAGYKLPEKSTPFYNINVSDSPGAMTMVNSTSSVQVNYQNNPEIKNLVDDLKDLIEELPLSVEKNNAQIIVESIDEECKKNNPSKPKLGAFLYALKDYTIITSNILNIAKAFGIDLSRGLPGF